jgi:hypothetical protein
MIIIGNDGRNATIILDLIEMKAINELLKLVGIEQAKVAAETVAKDGFEVDANAVVAFAKAFDNVGKRLLKTVNVLEENKSDDAESEVCPSCQAQENNKGGSGKPN